MAGPESLVAITCAALEDEVAALVAEGAPVSHVEVLPLGLHEEPGRLRGVLQEAIDRVEAARRPDAIALVNGLCSGGTEGLRAAHARLVQVRAHDCIALLLGSRQRYADYVRAHPGTYWYSPGWNRHHLAPGPERYERLRQDYAKRYGEDNADYLMEAEQGWFRTYARATYVDWGGAGSDAGIAFARRCAAWLGWDRDRQVGDPTLLRDLLTMRWDEDRFLVLEPGESAAISIDDRVIERRRSDA